MTANNSLFVHQALFQINRIKSCQPPIRDAEALKTNKFHPLLQLLNADEFAEPHFQHAFSQTILPVGLELLQESGKF